MNYIKKYKKFFEDGGVISAQPGSLPGSTGTAGSGDIGFPLKKEKSKKGDATEVSDLLDLEPSKTNKVDDVKLSDPLRESIIGDKIKCDKCGWSWKIKDGGEDPYICHKCYHNNEPN